jgi:hypothetical protein
VFSPEQEIYPHRVADKAEELIENKWAVVAFSR